MAWSRDALPRRPSVSSFQSSRIEQRVGDRHPRQLFGRQAGEPQEGVVAPLHQALLDDRDGLARGIEHGALDAQRFGQASLARLQRGEVGVHADGAGEASVPDAAAAPH